MKKVLRSIYSRQRNIPFLLFPASERHSELHLPSYSASKSPPPGLLTSSQKEILDTRKENSVDNLSRYFIPTVINFGPCSLRSRQRKFWHFKYHFTLILRNTASFLRVLQFPPRDLFKDPLSAVQAIYNHCYHLSLSL